MRFCPICGELYENYEYECNGEKTVLIYNTYPVYEDGKYVGFKKGKEYVRKGKDH